MKSALRKPLADDHRPDLRAELATFVRRRRRLLTVLGVGVLGVGIARWGPSADAGSLDASLAAMLAGDGLEMVGGAVWLEDEGLLTTVRPAVFAAARRGEPADVYYADVQVDGSAVDDVAWLTNLTHTSSADERSLIALGPTVIYASVVGDRFDAVTLLDTRGEPGSLTAGWPRRARVQNAITNLQETGRLAGFGRRRYGLVEPARSLELAARGGRFVIVADGARTVIDPAAEAPVEGADLVELRPQARGMPGTITWVVDTVRNLSFVGPEPIEWLEHRVFGVKDWFERTWYAIVGADAAEEAAEAVEDMGVTAEQRRRRLTLSVTDPEIGWPPAPLEPIIRPSLDGEGEWIPVVDDPFVASYPNAPPAFCQTFLRPDEERGYARVYVTVFDPRHVQLHIMTGTREPESATGETGPGMAPRDPETLRRLVGGFNGGFQALHGEFGMMSEGRVYLPPKPWAATVAVRADGRVAMGSWTDPPEGVRVFEERWAVAQIPADFVDMRQNLTSVVEGDLFNPWGRWWWGAAPQDAEEQTFIDRTALCLTSEGFLAYFYGKSLGPEALGRAMLATRCVRGIHLDMNSRHTGFEFYDVRRRGEPRPPLARPLTDAEHEGPVPFADGWVVRARKMVRRMTPMHFPRYIDRDGRDFFYLTLKPILPGPDLEAEADGAGQFSTEGLPHAGWPHAFARAWLGTREGRSWLVRIDPRRALPPPLAPAGSERALAWLLGARTLAVPGAPFALYAEPAVLRDRIAVGAPPEGARVVLAGDPVSRTPDAGAAIGVDPDGYLLYVEREERDPRSLSQRLVEAGVPADRAVALPVGVRLAFVVDGALVAPDAYERPGNLDDALPLYADERPATEILFPDVEPRPYSRWWRMQDTRVRYRREGPPTFSRGGGGLRDPDAGPGADPGL